MTTNQGLDEMPIPMKVPNCLAFACIPLIGMFAGLVGAAEPSQIEPLQPIIAAASDEAEQALKGIRLPEDWRITLYAAEPDVANIVAFDVDNRGRVFVCESFRQNRGVTDNREHDETWLLADLAAKTVQDRIDYHKQLLGDAAPTYSQQDDRIRRLQDIDGDGQADVSTLVANRFNRIEEGTGASVLVRGSDIYFTCIPKLWKLTDEDDDGKADGRDAMSDGYGVRVAFRGHDLHGLLIGPDGRLYFSIGDRGYNVATDDGRVLADPASGAVFRCELDGSGLEVFATGMRNPQELVFNDIGDLFSVDNNSDSGDRARIIHILEGGDSGWRMHYQYLPDRGPFNRERIWEPLHNEQPAYLVPPIANFSDGPSGLTFYPGTGFGDRLKNRFILCDFRGTPGKSGVRTFELEADGAFYKLSADDQPIWSVLATDVAFTPDGALLISDWVDGWNGVGKGRLYRVFDPHYQQSPIAKQVSELLAGDWTTYEVSQLSRNLSHADRRIRFESQWELARRGELQPLLEIAVDAKSSSMARLHAIWGADHIARLDSDKVDKTVSTLAQLLAEDDATLRAAAAKVMGERGDLAATDKLRTLLEDVSPRVPYFAAMALAKLHDTASLPAIVRLLNQNNNQDPALRHAGVMFLASVKDKQKIVSLANHKSVPVRRAAAVAMRRAKHGDVAKFLSDEDGLVALEAARAIHDVPIRVAMPALAESIEESSEDAEFVRRGLNANLHLGTESAANRIAEYAARESAPPKMRLEALDILANWDSKDPRDRVLGSYRPLSERDPSLASRALEAQLDTLMNFESSIREKATAVAASLGIKKIAPQIAVRVTNDELMPADRAAALQALSRLDPAQALAFAKTVPVRPANQLTVAAIGVLAELDQAKSLPTFVEATKSANVQLRQSAWDVLGNSESDSAVAAIADGVQRYIAGSLSADVHLNVLEAAKGKLDSKLQQQLDEHEKALAESNPLANWLAALDGGDVDAGRKLFFEKTQLSCVRCHKIGLSGGEVGPSLNNVAKEKDRRYLLESICLPDATIAKGFETVVLADDSGQVYTGIVRQETDEHIDLMQPDGVERRIPTDEIVAKRKGKSAMPDDLVKQMTLRELRDLVAYLAILD
jgi:quinoprotein glucose dehydrogenase